MKLEIKIYPDPLLKKKAQRVKEITPEIKELISRMKETMVNPPSLEEGSIAAGLAANQVGVLQRIIIVNFGKKLRGFINPQIVRQSRVKEVGKEGCLSFPGIWLEIKRAVWAEVRALDERGETIHLRVEGFLAKVFQHEIDHLDGILFFERLGLLARLKTERKIERLLKKPRRA